MAPWGRILADMVLVTATGFNDQGKVLAVPRSCLLSSVLPFVEVNSNSLCLGQRCRNWGGKLSWSWDQSLLCFLPRVKQSLGQTRKFRVMAMSLKRFLSPDGSGTCVCRQERSLGRGGGWIPLRAHF